MHTVRLLNILEPRFRSKLQSWIQLFTKIATRQADRRRQRGCYNFFSTDTRRPSTRRKCPQEFCASQGDLLTARFCARRLIDRARAQQAAGKASAPHRSKRLIDRCTLQLPFIHHSSQTGLSHSKEDRFIQDDDYLRCRVSIARPYFQIRRCSTDYVYAPLHC